MPHVHPSGFPPRSLDHRSAGVRPPRFFFVLARSARACPSCSPSVDCDRLIAIGSRAGALELQKGRFWIPERGGLSSAIVSGSERISLVIDAWRGTGPRPTVKRAVLAPVSRGPVPRDRRRGTNPRAPLCSLRSPDRNRVKIAWQVCQSFRRS